jgi:hypothetical protein
MGQHAEPPDARPAPDPRIGSGNYKPLIRFGSSVRRSMPMSPPGCEWGISPAAPGELTRKTEVTRHAPRPTPAGMPIAAARVSRCEVSTNTPHSQSSVSWAPKRHGGGARPAPASRAAIGHEHASTKRPFETNSPSYVTKVSAGPTHSNLRSEVQTTRHAFDYGSASGSIDAPPAAAR